MDDLEDLIGFLDHSKPQVRQHAVDLVQGLTGSPEGISQLASRGGSLLPPLLRLACAESSLARPALASLVNISQEPSGQNTLLELNAPTRCMDYLRDETSSGNEDLLVMLLANLTADENGAAALLQVGKGPLEGLNLAILIQRFLAPRTDKDIYEHVATILPNVTRFEVGRRVLMEPGRGTLRALASQLRSPSELRRRGCSGAIKNCCFSCEEDGTADAIGAESEALTDMLSTLCGTVHAETDAIVRENLAEAIVCLAKVPTSRKHLWEANVPDLLRKGYEFEEHPGVCEAMEAAAELFLQDGFSLPPNDTNTHGADAVLEGEGTMKIGGPPGMPGSRSKAPIGEPPSTIHGNIPEVAIHGSQGRVIHIEEIDE